MKLNSCFPFLRFLLRVCVNGCVCVSVGFLFCLFFTRAIFYFVRKLFSDTILQLGGVWCSVVVATFRETNLKKTQSLGEK